MAGTKKQSAQLIDISGQKFGRLTVLNRVPTPAHYKNQGRAYWECQCECGNLSIVQGKSLRAGGTLSCGCLRVERFEEQVITHGHATPGRTSPTYISWQHMRRRCLDPTNDRYDRYGGRGISICERWDSFEAFLEDMGERPEGKTLDRYPDKDGNYEPGNCRWATHKEQQDNRSVSLIYEYDGKSQTLKDWAKETGIRYATLRCRIREYGWSVERALSTPSLIDRSKQCQ